MAITAGIILVLISVITILIMEKYAPDDMTRVGE